MHAVLHKHCVQAGEQIDSIMKGQVRAGKPYLYILAWHVTKKDIPLSHNVGQLAYTHTNSHRESPKDWESTQQLSSLVLDSIPSFLSQWQVLVLVLVLVLWSCLLATHARIPNAKCKFYL